MFDYVVATSVWAFQISIVVFPIFLVWFLRGRHRWYWILFWILSDFFTVVSVSMYLRYLGYPFNIDVTCGCDYSIGDIAYSYVIVLGLILAKFIVAAFGFERKTIPLLVAGVWTFVLVIVGIFNGGAWGMMYPYGLNPPKDWAEASKYYDRDASFIKDMLYGRSKVRDEPMYIKNVPY